MLVICFTTSAGECRSIRRLCTRSSNWRKGKGRWGRYAMSCEWQAVAATGGGAQPWRRWAAQRQKPRAAPIQLPSKLTRSKVLVPLPAGVKGGRAREQLGQA